MNDAHYDAIILLGRSLNLDGSIVDEDRPRLEKIAQLYADRSADAIVVCGSRGYKSVKKAAITQAQAYANYLEALGVPRAVIYLEAESQETLGNILFAKMHIPLMHDWRKLLVIPTPNHSTERVRYLLQKILGNDYSWDIVRVGENKEQANIEREAKALKHTRDINDAFADGDHVAIYNGLMKTHPAYGGTKWTVDELREEMKH